MVNGVQVAVGVFMQGDRILVIPHPGILLGEATNGRIVISGPEIVVIQAAIKLFAGVQVAVFGATGAIDKGAVGTVIIGVGDGARGVCQRPS